VALAPRPRTLQKPPLCEGVLVCVEVCVEGDVVCAGTIHDADISFSHHKAMLLVALGLCYMRSSSIEPRQSPHWLLYVFGLLGCH